MPTKNIDFLLEFSNSADTLFSALCATEYYLIQAHQ